VLPTIAHRTFKQISRARFNVYGPALPFLPNPLAQPQRAIREKRYGDDAFKRRFVDVPADSSAGWILGNHELFECIGGRSADVACDLCQWQKVVRNARVVPRLLARKDIPIPALKSSSSIPYDDETAERVFRLALYDTPRSGRGTDHLERRSGTGAIPCRDGTGRRNDDNKRTRGRG